MTYKKWLKKYKPVKNHLVPTAPYDGCMFETYDEEKKHVDRHLFQHVWTLVDDEGDKIRNGRHKVNRIGYFITEVPWEGCSVIQVKVDV